MEILSEYGIFLAKVLTLLVAVSFLIGMIFNLMRGKADKRSGAGELEVRHLNEDYERAALTIKSAMLSGKAYKAERKASKARRRAQQKSPRNRLFVLDFHGDLRASALVNLRQEITAVLTIAGREDEILIKLESGGGQVHAYGLAAAQLLRIRDRGIPLTIAVDKMAASGGYMMACVADRIIAAPFAILGSIGVIAQLPNFNRLLRKHDVDFEQFMAGEHKRTVTLFGENTDQGREKFQQEIEEAHVLFKDFVNQHRPGIDLAAVATGEYWYGTRAMDHGLVDELLTSDDYLLKASQEVDLYQITHTGKKPLLARLLGHGTESRLW
jgi:serine protease SohB